jgi:2,3-bisphosphoglycerate-independent phosphoglycerate mutase
MDTAKKGNGRLHLLGLVSDGGVHSHIQHLFAFLEAAKAAGVPETYVHFFGDGRDTDPKSAAGYMQELLDKFDSLKYGKLGTVVGRYYAMDRDKRWERIQVAVDALTQGKGDEGTDNPVEDIKARYHKKETDEFLKPIIYSGQDGRIQGIPPRNSDDPKYQTRTLLSSSIIDQIAFVKSYRFSTSTPLLLKEKSNFPLTSH